MKLKVLWFVALVFCLSLANAKDKTWTINNPPIGDTDKFAGKSPIRLEQTILCLKEPKWMMPGHNRWHLSSLKLAMGRTIPLTEGGLTVRSQYAAPVLLKYLTHYMITKVTPVRVSPGKGKPDFVGYVFEIVELDEELEQKEGLEMSLAVRSTKDFDAQIALEAFGRFRMATVYTAVAQRIVWSGKSDVDPSLYPEPPKPTE